MYDDNAISKVTMLLHYSLGKGIQMLIEVGKLRLQYLVGEVHHYNM